MKSSKSFFTVTALLMALLQGAIHAFAQPSTPRDSTWITDGKVHAVAYSKGLIYIGGDFTYVGPNTGYGAALNTTTGAPDLKFQKVNGTIEVVTADGADGWYIGGSFTKVGNFTRNGLAHIKADGTLDPNWDPNPAGTLLTNSIPVHAIIVSGATVYVGGSFTSIGGQQRKDLAALTVSTGQATSWNPNASHIVRAMVINGATMYVGGDFDAIGGQNRKFIAAIDTATGSATAWNPTLNARVYTIVVSDTLVFAGGEFTSAGGQVRNYLAAFGITSGQVTTWNPGATGPIYVLAAKGSTLYVGGNFKAVGGLSRPYIAALSIYSNIPLNWNPISNGPIREIYLNGATVCVGGNFTKIDGQSRYRIAALDETTGKATAWTSHASAAVRGLATNTNGSVIYAGGEFRSIGGQLRSRLAALDASTGFATAWWNSEAIINESISAIAVSGSNVYIGGVFTKIGTSVRNRLAAINAATSALTTWNPNANGFVHAITIDNSTVYVGGTFSTIGGQKRNLLAALDINTGLAKSWNPNVIGSKFNTGAGGVYTILVNGATIYAGGEFYSVGFQLREALAAIDANTGQATEWNPNLNASSIVYAMALDGSTLYIGGGFNTVKGQTRNRLAAIDITTGDPTAWNPNANVTVQALILNGANVYVGGHFTSIGAQTRIGLAAIDKTTGMPTDWNPNPNTYGYGQGLIAVGSAILVGGAFTTMGGNMQDYFAQFGDIVETNNSPNAPSALNQYKTDATTVISEGGTSNENKVVFKGTVSDPDGEQVKLQIELRKTTEAFTGVPNLQSSLVNSGAPVTIAAENLVAANYKWRFRAMDASGLANAWTEFGTPSNTDFIVNIETGVNSNGETSLPANYRLLQNQPNPFNAGTLIKYEIPEAGRVSIKIYNLAGQEILEIMNAVQPPGRYQINWNGRDNAGRLVPSGIYVYKLLANGFEETRKMTFMK
jgi:FlgD Ig-like domain/Domain of unknown function (DUF5122) beta-propeller